MIKKMMFSANADLYKITTHLQIRLEVAFFSLRVF